MIYQISYDLKNKSKDYIPLFKKIQSLGNWWHYLDSTWLVQPTGIYSGYTPVQMNQYIRDVIDSDDFILITRVDLNESDGWLPQKAWDWIREHNQ